MPKLAPYVHPVYKVSGAGEPAALGSSVLLRRGRQLYLASAAHVLDDNQDTPEREASSLYVGGSHGELCLFEADFLQNKKPADLAVAVLTGDLSAAWDCSPAVDVDSQVATGETSGLHLVLGYPARRAAFTLDRATNTIKHSMFKYAQVRKDRKKDGEHHFFSMRMNRGHVKRGAVKQRAPSPAGVSGGAVFCRDTATSPGGHLHRVR